MVLIAKTRPNPCFICVHPWQKTLLNRLVVVSLLCAWCRCSLLDQSRAIAERTPTLIRILLHCKGRGRAYDFSRLADSRLPG
ncbi:MAG: hypothetical protein JWN70_2567 [Planctomycetaceae bacterium]|nr:hypothetical protein [Planctomycetaceae bacterium]